MNMMPHPHISEILHILQNWTESNEGGGRRVRIEQSVFGHLCGQHTHTHTRSISLINDRTRMPGSRCTWVSLTNSTEHTRTCAQARIDT